MAEQTGRPRGSETQAGPQMPGTHAELAPLVIGAAGIVFGDIGTSPLYTMKTVLELGGG